MNRDTLLAMTPRAKWVDRDPPAIEELTKALLIVYANWSAHSVVIADKILEALVHGRTSLPDIFILDIDEISPEYIRQLLGGAPAHGFAESVWVEKGQMIQRYTQKEELPAFIEFVKVEELADDGDGT
ncbi:hypothetical protein [Flavilitoribacter nigricans]|uniref:Thioredoxin family protein n=1 Tax=Flavilitoribacter nigricans (strain ATCC 23147 / DSM 23189 / NBRC 102662 / NCIMB 1420 / SS-2) TaxID=1122177 RepID=A0A2D0NHB2_FLAN2|nr:hypothetical protein [Flavilitoribacter nigricans]PHN07776.1 hypothetical protein CRP01_04455 [Flavilitoribacter nigricans DSM 23189 = NBRC 102662]